MNMWVAKDFRDKYESKVGGTVDYLKYKLGDHKPIFGVTLGSGLGDLADHIDKICEIPYEEIPHFPKTTAPGHEGKLIAGHLEGVPIIGLKGRKHYYEVADEFFNVGMLQTILPIHTIAGLGVKNYFVTNAAGGLNLEYNVGDIMIINSHINFLPNPLLGRHHDFKRVDNNERIYKSRQMSFKRVEKNPRISRFQPMNGAYDSDLIKILEEAGSNYKDYLHKGVYLAVTGPTYETEGESVAFRDGLKADAVGMSTTNEVIVARNRGMNVVGFSCITNKIAKDGTSDTNHEEVKKILESSEVKERLSSTVRNFFKLYKEKHM